MERRINSVRINRAWPVFEIVYKSLYWYRKECITYLPNHVQCNWSKWVISFKIFLTLYTYHRMDLKTTCTVRKHYSPPFKLHYNNSILSQFDSHNLCRMIKNYKIQNLLRFYQRTYLYVSYLHSWNEFLIICMKVITSDNLNSLLMI